MPRPFVAMPRAASAAAPRLAAPVPASPAWRYGIAAALAVAGILLARIFVEPLAGAPFLFSMAAVCVAALVGGTGPGLLAVAVCAAGYPLVASDDLVTFPTEPTTHLARLGLFLLVGAAQSFGAGALRRARATERRARFRSELRAERQRRARVRASEQLQLLRAVTGDLAEGLCALGEDGRVAFANAAASRMLGWTEADLVGRRLDDLTHPRRPDDWPSCPWHPMLSVLGSASAVKGDDQVLTRRDGSSFPVSYSSSPIVRGGKVVGAAIAFQDITAPLRAARAEKFVARATEALTESIDWEATVQRVAALAVPFLGDWCLVVVVEQGRARSVAVESSEPARAAGARELLERYPIDLAAAHGVGRVLRTGEAELLSETSLESFVVERGESSALRAEILLRLGLRSYLCVPLVARGRTLGAIAFGIAEGTRRFAEEDLAVARELALRCALALDNARLYREAREATCAREEVLAVVSHDLRAPLGAAQLAAQVLSRLVSPCATPELRRAADTVHRATGRLARLVDDLVDFARLERGALPLELTPADPAALAREALSVVEPLAEEQAISVRLEEDPGLPSVRCDRHRILQVLANLLGNAVKVMPGGGSLHVGVRCREGEVRFSVSDTGPGIQAEDLARVFERYWRGKNPGYDGMGLGLAIARAVVEAHGGRIWAVSAAGEGATFHFALPHDQRGGAG